MDDDHALLRRYADFRSEDAFCELVRRYLPVVYSAALRRTDGDPYRAREVAQVVFIALAREAARLRGETILVGWLHVATRNAAANLRRAERRRVRYEREAFLMSAVDQRNTKADDWTAIRPLLEDAIDTLPERDRDAVLMRFFEKRPFQAIGAALGSSEDAARMRVDRALEKLRGVLARRGVTSSAVALGSAIADHAVAAVPTEMVDVVASTALAASSGNAALTLLTSMKISKLTAAAVVVVLLTLGTAIYEAAHVRRTETQLTAIVAERDALVKSLAELKTRNGQSVLQSPSGERTFSTEPKPLESRPATTPVETTMPISAAVLRAENPLASLYALRGSPEAMEAWLRAERSGLDLQLGPLFVKLALTPEQIERFKGIMMDRFQTLADLIGTAQAQGLPMSDSAIQANYRTAVEKMESDLHALLGDTGYESMKQFGATTTVRELVKATAGDLASTPSPLSAIETERLVQVIAAHSQLKGSRPAPENADWGAIFAEAAGFLSPAQVAALRAEHDQFMLRVQLDTIGKKSAKR